MITEVSVEVPVLSKAMFFTKEPGGNFVFYTLIADYQKTVERSFLLIRDGFSVDVEKYRYVGSTPITYVGELDIPDTRRTEIIHLFEEKTYYNSQNF